MRIGHFCAAAALQSLFERGTLSGYRLSWHYSWYFSVAEGKFQKDTYLYSEMSTRSRKIKFLRSKARLMRRADNRTTVYEPIRVFSPLHQKGVVSFTLLPFCFRGEKLSVPTERKARWAQDAVDAVEKRIRVYTGNMTQTLRPAPASGYPGWHLVAIVTSINSISAKNNICKNVI
jgi:hypothetical protein